jgi:ferric enterobactin receptor
MKPISCAWIVMLSLVFHRGMQASVPSVTRTCNLTLRCDRKPLRNVLKTLSDRSGVGFVFQDDLIAGRSVSCEFDNLPMGRALDSLLNPLGIAYKRISNGPFVLYDEQTANRLIKGWVVDASSGNGLSYANIVEEGTSAGTTSETDGSFLLRNSRSDSCTIRVSYLGYRPEQIRLHSADGPDSIRIAMHEKPIETGSVDVEAERIPDLIFAEQAGEIVFSPRCLEDIPSADGGFGRTLQLLPGVEGACDQAGVLEFFGGTDSENLLLLDDIPLYQPATYYGWLGPLHPRMFEKVTVHKGGYPATIGDRTGGLLELTGNTVPENRFNAGIGADLFSTNAFVEWPLTGNLRGFASARLSHPNIVKGRYYREINDFLRVNSGPSFSGTVNGKQIVPVYQYSFSDAAAKIVYSGGDDRFSSTFFCKLEKDGYDSHVRESGFENVIQDFRRLNHYGLSGRWEHDWNRRFSSNLIAVYSEYSPSQRQDARSQTPNGTLYYHRFREDGQDLAYRALKSDNRVVMKRHVLDFGIEFVRKNFLKDQYGLDRASAQPDFSDGMTRMSFSRTRVSNCMAYVQNRWSPGLGVDLTFGLRGMRSEYRDVRHSDWITPGTGRKDGNRKFYLDPRFSMRAGLTNRLSADLAMGIYHQFGHPSLIRDIELEPSLIHEKEWDPVSIPGAESRHLILDLLYETDRYGLMMEGVVKTWPDLRPYDRGSARTEGVEWTARKKKGFLTGWFSYRLNRSVYRLDRYNGGTVPAFRDRPHELKAVSEFHLGSLRFSFVGCLASGKPYTAQKSMTLVPIGEGAWDSIIDAGPVNGSRLPSYQRIDVLVSKRWNRLLRLNWETGVSLLNVFDRKNIWYRDYTYDVWDPPNGEPLVPTIQDIPMLGFTPMASIEVTLN